MNANVRAMERQRLADEQPCPDLDDDATLEAVETLMRINPRYKAAMRELIQDFLIRKGETLAINLGIDFPPEDEA